MPAVGPLLDALGSMIAVAVVLLALVSSACAPSAPLIAATPKPTFCVAEQPGLQEITTTPASPYLVHHPAASIARTATVVFLPGGSGLKRNAQRVWDTMLAGTADAGSFRIVLPYWPDVEMLGDFRRVLAVIDEILTCYRGDPALVHLAGTSNGGHAAFDLMLERPERFATLLGAPGEFQLPIRPADLLGLRGKAVFNGVGEFDDEFWHKGVRDAHGMLTTAGVDSVYVEFTGQRHSAGEGFPKDVLFEFWTKHGAPKGR